MHISEGVFKAEILIPCGIVATAICAYLLYKLKTEDIAHTACMSAVFFLGSLIHLPLGPSSIHLLLSGLIGAFAGRNAFVAIFFALILQGLLFGFGGFSVLGVNALMIGLPAILGGYFVKFGKKAWFFVGFVPILISSIILFIVLMLNGDEFVLLAKIALIPNIILMVLEGIISFFALIFINKINTGLLK